MPRVQLPEDLKVDLSREPQERIGSLSEQVQIGGSYGID